MIECFINQVVGQPIPKAFWTARLKKIERVLKLRKNMQLSVAVVGTAMMRTLNKRYRGKDAVTDVLSFADKDVKVFLKPAKAVTELGEVILCYPQIKKQARERKKTFNDELGLLFVHGVLHLFGYDHQTNKDATLMERLEQKILAK